MLYELFFIELHCIARIEPNNKLILQKLNSTCIRTFRQPVLKEAPQQITLFAMKMDEFSFIDKTFMNIATQGEKFRLHKNKY